MKTPRSPRCLSLCAPSMGVVSKVKVPNGDGNSSHYYVSECINFAKDKGYEKITLNKKGRDLGKSLPGRRMGAFCDRKGKCMGSLKWRNQRMILVYPTS